jgi:hypothetical protein
MLRSLKIHLLESALDSSIVPNFQPFYDRLDFLSRQNYLGLSVV